MDRHCFARLHRAVLGGAGLDVTPEEAIACGQPVMGFAERDYYAARRWVVHPFAWIGSVGLFCDNLERLLVGKPLLRHHR